MSIRAILDKKAPHTPEIIVFYNRQKTSKETISTIVTGYALKI